MALWPTTCGPTQPPPPKKTWNGDSEDNTVDTLFRVDVL